MHLILPFASKELPNGQRLYRRKHGYSFSCLPQAEFTYTIVVPYNIAKINEMEIIGAPQVMAIDMKVLDTAAGTLTGVPNFMLNQFGFDVQISPDFYRDTSQYDADVYKDMQIQVVFKNPTLLTFAGHINLTFHEVKAAA